MIVVAASTMPLHERYKKLFALLENALTTHLLDELAERTLPEIAGIGETEAVFLYVADSRLRSSKLFPHGYSPEQAGEIKRICSEQEKKLAIQNSIQTIILPAETSGSRGLDLVLYAFSLKTKSFMIIGCKQPAGAAPQADIFDHLVRILAPIISMIVERMQSERQLTHLNAYLTVSSMLAKSQGLHEVLEIALYSCMELVAAEAASVLLLDEEKKNFSFYQVEGPAKPVLMAAASFPSDQGLAGALLKTREAEVINGVQSDPRFYKVVDESSGFKTRNMIAVPLIAEEECVGVLEVLNKAQGWLFRDEERLLLLSLAEEIAFAIRNARVFEYIAHSYCKQRQGQNSCAGCKRPLGSWTPCVKYREELL